MSAAIAFPDPAAAISSAVSIATHCAVRAGSGIYRGRALHGYSVPRLSVAVLVHRCTP